MRLYRKKCTELQVEPLKKIKEDYDEYEAGDAENIPKFHFWDELGWNGTRAIMDALREAV
jgi:hypothetical protein